LSCLHLAAAGKRQRAHAGKVLCARQPLGRKVAARARAALEEEQEVRRAVFCDVSRLEESKVCQDGPAPRRQQNVFGLDVAVAHAGRVRLLDGAQQLEHDPQSLDGG